MKYLNLIINFGNVVGFTLVVLGFFLIPFLVGVPMMIAGILLLVFNFYKRWVEFIVPEKTRNKVREEIIESYKPYQPAIKSMKGIGKEIVKISFVVFIIGSLIIYFILRK